MKIKLNYKKIKRNILIIIFVILAIKYIQIISNYNNTKLERYAHFVEYAKDNDIAITKTNYESYILNNK